MAEIRADSIWPPLQPTNGHAFTGRDD